ncbi:MORN repeat-containing protein [Moraxella nonliquefaciens]|uniref:MORN motif n=1 Tax=Moraxella nonliquefaciens TaxID=478 RepID=A0A1B8QTC0_MORNO|nr:hypothetical protein [Moraxella nonliquefaciens]OBX88457.1 hypothetical protein A7456_00960 [Moraxella nonliquefaciens]QPT44480.1 hypothetical protein I6G26_10675 [Moraxella nonliquefaciens]QQC29500.1 hypothetical protein I6H63_09455 [Moraxella nonliquefaciens]
MSSQVKSSQVKSSQVKSSQVKSSQLKLNKILVGLALVMGMGVSHTALANNWITTSNNKCKVYNPTFFKNIPTTWSGECKDGYVHGQGTLQLRIYGELYETYVGSFSQGKQYGKGIYTRRDGIKYDGEFKDGKMHGKGIKTWANGSKYDGEFKDGKMHGKGIKTWANGSKYDGEFKDHKMHGKGIKTWANGSKYDGEYKDDKKHGLGKLTLVKGDNGIASYDNGEWQGDTYVVQGEFVNGDHTLQCEPNQKACDKARAEQEKQEQERREREYKGSIEACKSRYVGERLILKAPYNVGFIFYSEGYKYFPFKVVGVGKDKMTVEAMYDGSDISDIRSANILCNATSVK